MTQPSSSTSSSNPSNKRPKKKPASSSSTRQHASQPMAARSTTKKPSQTGQTTPAAKSGAGKAGSRPAGSASSNTGSKRDAARQSREATLQRSQQQRQRRRRQRGSNRGLWLAIGGTVAAVAAIIILFIVLGRNATPTNGNYPVSAVDPTVLKQVTTVDLSVLASVGTGQGQSPPSKLNGASALTGANGKPEVFYYGAEYCPYCAAERWSLIVALSRFGTFSNLHQAQSSSTDVYPSTHTFSFYQSSYTSQYLDFVALEVESYQGVALQTPTADQQKLVNQYNPNGSFPFVDIANKYTIVGASYSPQVLSNMSWQQIASALSNTQSPVAQNVLGAANYLTAAICEATNQQPASVCQAAPIPQVQQSLGSSTGNTGTQGPVVFAPAAVFRAESSVW